MNQTGWWEIFMKTGNPDIYMKYTETEQEEEIAADKNPRDSGTEYGCGRLQ